MSLQANVHFFEQEATAGNKFCVGGNSYIDVSSVITDCVDFVVQLLYAVVL